MTKKSNHKKILSLLKKHYPEAGIVLKYSNNWELLVAVVLSAQSTDKQVNKVTDKLFEKYKSIEDYAKADLKKLEQDVYSSGFYRNKAKNIKNSAQIILDKYNGKIPDTMDKLVNLPGIGRKTANVILGNAFNKAEGIAVDTHVKRLSQRLGFTDEKTPEKIEQDLMNLFSKNEWYTLTYLLIEHGRNFCTARNPKCKECFLNEICPTAFKG